MLLEGLSTYLGALLVLDIVGSGLLDTRGVWPFLPHEGGSRLTHKPLYQTAKLTPHSRLLPQSSPHSPAIVGAKLPRPTRPDIPLPAISMHIDPEIAPHSSAFAKTFLLHPISLRSLTMPTK